METEKVNMGETAPDKDFLDRVDEIAVELRSMADKDRENRFVLLLAGDESKVMRMLQGHAGRLANISGRSLAADEEGREVLQKRSMMQLSQKQKKGYPARRQRRKDKSHKHEHNNEKDND